MRYAGIALDYDGTLATDGVVPPEVVAALQRARASGRRIIMVTGRELPALEATFAHVALFDRVVAENGGLLYSPQTKEHVSLAEAPAPSFLAALQARGIPVSVGAVIVATWTAHLDAVREIVAASSIELDVVLNKGAVMILPAGINKGTGVARAAAALGLDLQRVVGMGDGENDHSLLRACGVGVAVGNAVDALKDQADLVTRGARGEGVIEIVDRLLADDLAGITPRARQEVSIAANDETAQAAG